jgi:hypothetical protein
VVFESRAKNAMKAPDSGEYRRVYLRDLKTGELVLASKSTKKKPSGDSEHPWVSNDGNWVLFDSTGTNVTNGPDANDNTQDIYRPGPRGPVR